MLQIFWTQRKAEWYVNQKSIAWFPTIFPPPLVAFRFSPLIGQLSCLGPGFGGSCNFSVPSLVSSVCRTFSKDLHLIIRSAMISLWSFASFLGVSLAVLSTFSPPSLLSFSFSFVSSLLFHFESSLF